MSQHTPGPWIVGDDHLGSTRIEAESGHMTLAMVNGKAQEQPANARLIASAPDLLAALVELVSTFDRKNIPLLANAQTAIAKATGKESK